MSDPTQQADTQKEQLFSKWTATELNHQEQQQFEIWCKEDEEFAARVAVHGRLQSLTDNYEPQDVPDWDPGALFETPEKTPWWQWRGLSAASFAMSVFAVLLVTFQIEVTINDGSMTISFAGANQQQKIEQLVNDKIIEYAKLQETSFSEKSEILQQQQMQMNTQLASYLLDTSRTERREDFAELIKHVNQQRADDQVFYARQITRLKTDIELETGEPHWLPTEFEQTNSDNE